MRGELPEFPVAPGLGSTGSTSLGEEAMNRSWKRPSLSSTGGTGSMSPS